MLKLKAKPYILILCLLAVLLLAGCDRTGVVINQTAGDSGGQGQQDETGQYSEQEAYSPPAQEDAQPLAPAGLPLNITPAPQIQLTLQPYDGGYFSLYLPMGWVIETVGEFQNFGFRAYDPANPTRQIIFYGTMSYFMKSEAGRQGWLSYAQNYGYPGADVYYNAPVLSPATTEQFFYTFNDFAAYANYYGIDHNFPYFSNIQVLERAPRNSPISYACVDDSLLRMVFEQEGQVCEGLFGAGVADALTYYMYNVDTGYYTVYYTTGISAPAEEFHLICDTLAQALGSFQFAESYIQQGVNLTQWGTEVALEVGRTLSQAAESSARSWHDRQRPLDTVGQKLSDSTLGYDRLYDPDTGDVYRAELGFYDEYDINRDAYSNGGLQKVNDNDYQLYDQALSGYIYR